MAVPKKKTSKQRTHSRRANWKLELPGVSECPQCHKPKESHRICRFCGYYDGKQIIKTETEGKNKNKA